MTKYYKCDSKRYWHIDTIVQKEIIQCISLISGCPTGKIKIGVDGCGVPVFALPLKFLAKSYMMLACPQFINDEGIRSSVREVSNLQSKITFRF